MYKIRLTDAEQILLSFVLNPINLSIAECIARTKKYFTNNGIKINSETYYRKFLKQFKNDNPLLWDYLKTGRLQKSVILESSRILFKVRRNTIHYNQKRYYNEKLAKLNGQLVTVKYAKGGQTINVFDRSDKFICSASEIMLEKIGTIKPLRKNTSKFFQDKPGAKK